MSADAEHLALTLTPYGAQRFFGLPMSELRGQVWELEVLLNRMAGEMHERLLEASGLENRFQILIDWVRAVLNAQGDQYDNQVRYAHAQLQASRGQLRIESLCKDLGVSRSWLARRFKHQVGMSPKRFARVLKFQHVIERIEAFAEVDWSGIALDCGYFDQAHFIRDFKALASHTPAQYLRQRAPGGGSIVIE